MLGVCHQIALRKDEYIFLPIKNDILVKLLNTLVKDHTLQHFLHTLVLKYIFIQRSDSAFVLKREKKLNSVTMSFKHLKTNKKNIHFTNCLKSYQNLAKCLVRVLH